MQTNFYISFDWLYFDICTSVLYIICTINIYRKDQYLCLDTFTLVAAVAESLRMLKHSKSLIISPPWVRALLGSHVGETSQVLLAGGQVFFSRRSPIFSPLAINSAQNE